MTRALRLIALVLAVVGTAATLGPVSALPSNAATAFAQPPLPPNATVVASGLLNPRGFTFAPDGALIVAESGAAPAGFEALGGPPTPTFRPGTSLSGRVSRVNLATGERTTLAEGLPSAALSFGDTLGPANVAYLGSDLYVAISAGPVHGWPNYPSGVYRVNPDGGVRLVANLDAFNSRNPVALITPDDEISNPYDMVAAAGALWITDGNRNQVYKVTPDGTISRVADLSTGHPVTTGIMAGPGGALIVVELTPVPFPQGAGRIQRISPDGQVETMATGTTTAVGVAMAADGTMFVVEHSVSLGRPPFLAPFTGRVARLTADRTLVTVADNLMFPTIARVGPDGALYVANFSVGGDNGEGQILRIDTGARPAVQIPR
ncbi:MAG: ScyD/ScyE family protein [Chloroflexi bacterium]|nr:ScyD/ScyE family protein [Chloroflexota bacterium]